MAGYVDFDITKKVVSDLRKLADVEVVVGIPPNSKRKPKKKGKPEPDNAVLAYIHETGDPGRNIPARPFLLPGVKAVETSNVTFMAQAGQMVLAGRFDEAMQILEDIGMDLENSVKLYLAQPSNFAPLSPRTIADRRRRGNSSTDPLADTDQMYFAITNYVAADGGRIKRTKSKVKP